MNNCVKKIRKHIKDKIDTLQYYHSVINVVEIGKAFLIRIYIYEPLKVIFQGKKNGTILTFTATKKNYKKVADLYLERFYQISRYTELKV